MTHLYLHIGMHKTGTSSIQETLFRNRSILAEAGYAYLDGRGNHSGILYAAFSSTPEKLAGHRRAGQRDRATLLARAAQVRARLDAFLRDAAQPNAVMSGEALSRLAPPDVRAMLEFFRARVDRITVIGFVRPPRSFMVSAIQQRIRGGRQETRAVSADWPRYRRKFGAYLDAGDLAETRLAVYASGELVRGCSVATMLSLCDAPADLYDRLALHQENLSMSRGAATLTLAVNAVRPRQAGPDARRAERLVSLLRHLPGPRFTVPDAVLDFHLCRPEPRRHVAWMEERLGRSMAEFEAPIPHGRPGHLVDPDDWTAANLTHLTRPEAEALLGLLRDGAAGGGAPRRKRARDGLQRAIAWLENRLAAPPVEPADAPWLRGAALQELAALLVGAEERPGEPQRPRGAADGDRPGLAAG